MISKFYYDRFFFKVRPGSDEWKAQNKERINQEAMRAIAKAKAERAAENGDGAPLIARGPPSEAGTPRPLSARPASARSYWDDRSDAGYERDDSVYGDVYENEDAEVASAHQALGGVPQKHSGGLSGMHRSQFKSQARPKTAGPLKSTRKALPEQERAPKTAKYTPRYSPRASPRSNGGGSDGGQTARSSQQGGGLGTPRWMVQEVTVKADGTWTPRPGSAGGRTTPRGNASPRSGSVTHRSQQGYKSPRPGTPSTPGRQQDAKAAPERQARPKTPLSAGSRTPRSHSARPASPRMHVEGSGMTPRNHSDRPSSRGVGAATPTGSHRSHASFRNPFSIPLEDPVYTEGDMHEASIPNPDPQLEHRFVRPDSRGQREASRQSIYEEPVTTRLEAPYIPAPSRQYDNDVDLESALTTWDRVQPTVSRVVPNSTAHDDFLYPSKVLEDVDRTYHFKWDAQRDYAEAHARQANMMDERKKA